MRNESELAQAVRRRIESRYEGCARKVHGSSYGKAGEPDIDACVRGRAVKVELKMPGNEPTPVQMGRLRAWQRAGALAGWVTSIAELDVLLEHVDDFGWTNPQLDRAGEPISVEATGT